MKNEIAAQSCALVSCKALAKILSLSPRTAWRLRSAGKLPKPVSVGSSIRWKLSDIELFMDCNCDMDRYRARREAENVE